MEKTFNYKPRVVDIRIKPPKKVEEEAAARDVLSLKPGQKPCEWPNCRKAGEAKAPKSRDMLNEHYWFCVAHAREYNHNWDYFTGMSDDEITRVQESRLTGDRPTWTFQASRFGREAAGVFAKARFSETSGASVCSSLRVKIPPAVHEKARRLGRLEVKALFELDLEETADDTMIRIRYLDLVKRCHPDTNGGDRSTEAKLQRVLKAYKTLKKAGLTS